MTVIACGCIERQRNRRSFFLSQVGNGEFSETGAGFGSCTDIHQICKSGAGLHQIHHFRRFLTCGQIKRHFVFLCGIRRVGHRHRQLPILPLQGDVQQSVGFRVFQKQSGFLSGNYGIRNRFSEHLGRVTDHIHRHVPVSHRKLECQRNASDRGQIASAGILEILPVKIIVDCIGVGLVQLHLIGQRIVPRHGVAVLEHCVCGRHSGVWADQTCTRRQVGAVTGKQRICVVIRAGRVILQEIVAVVDCAVFQRNLRSGRQCPAVRREYGNREGQKHCKNKDHAENLFHNEILLFFT